VSAAGSHLVELRERLLDTCAEGVEPTRRTRGKVTQGYGEVRPDGWLAPPGLPSGDRFATISSAATSAALRESSIRQSDTRIGLVMGTAGGPVRASGSFLARVNGRGPVGLSPSLFLDSMMSMPAGFVSISCGIRGTIAVVNGNHPLDVARLWLETGRESSVIVLATETFPDPWVNVAEGAGGRWPELAHASAALVIENRAHAERRRARCLGQIVGMATGTAIPKSRPGWSLSATAAQSIIADALTAARLCPDELDVILSCANGLRRFDAQESLALSRLNTRHSTLLRPKKLFGETVGAASIVSLLAATLVIENGSALSSARCAQKILVNNYELGGQFTAIVVTEAGS
jgi:3-oxoacyl-(acyl-carrier-protein) synthase